MNVTWTAYPYGLEMAYPASNQENALASKSFGDIQATCCLSALNDFLLQSGA
jgi:hypothetical protein